MLEKIQEGMNDQELEVYISNKIRYLIEITEKNSSKKQILQGLKNLENSFSQFTMRDKQKSYILTR